jgi:hypothetical protein
MKAATTILALWILLAASDLPEARASTASDLIERGDRYIERLGEIHRPTGEFEKARAHLRTINDAPFQEHRRPENELEKEAAKELLAQVDEEEKS